MKVIQLFTPIKCQIESTIIFIIFGDFLMFDQIFHLSQVKRCVIISNEHGVYELPYKLQNDSRLGS